VATRTFLQFPVISAGAEHLVMGYLMRRNILSYIAPPNNEGYDLICIHPDPRHMPVPEQLAQVRVQVKSRYATDADRGFLLKTSKLDAFDYLTVVFLNVGKFKAPHDGTTGRQAAEFYTLPRQLVEEHHNQADRFGKVNLQSLAGELATYRDDAGFELIAQALGVPPMYKQHQDTPNEEEAE
jgi:hypothetical protein